MSPGLTRGLKKGLRTVAQVAAGGGLTLLVTALTGTMTPTTAALVMGAFTAFVAFSQNWAEGSGKLPVLLPTPSLISGPTEAVVASVEATADEAGEITGDVLDTAGAVVGEVTGTVGGVVDDLLDGHPEGGGLDTVEDDSRIDERGGLGLFILLGVAALVVFGFAIDACFADSSERNDVGMARTEDNRPCEGDNACQGRQKKGCAEASAPCSDDDKVTIIICPQPDSCRFGEGEPS